jgi:hypothetical protein
MISVSFQALGSATSVRLPAGIDRFWDPHTVLCNWDITGGQKGWEHEASYSPLGSAKCRIIAALPSPTRVYGVMLE